MHIQYVILKVRLLSNKIPGKKIDFSLEVHQTEISQMELLSTMCQCAPHTKPYQRRRVGGRDRRRYEEVLEEGRGPRVPRSQGPKDQDISNSHSNTSLTLKKVHLVSMIIDLLEMKITEI